MFHAVPMRAMLQLCLLGAALSAGCDEDVPFGLEPREDEWMLGVLPDTQYYSARCPEVFDAQTQWLTDNAAALGLDFVVHLGDLTDDGSDAQWQVASDAMAILDGSVPYSVLPGNHDIGVSGDASDRGGQLDRWFPPERFSDALVETFPEGTSTNSFHRFTTRTGATHCVLALEFAPREATVAWADRVLSMNADCETTLTTHAFLDDDGERYDARIAGQLYHPDSYGVASLENVYDGQELYDALIDPHSQVRLVLSGHALGDGVARRLDSRGDGSVVLQMLSNYQELEPCGGDGFLRVLAISPSGVRVRTYSPVLDEIRGDDDHRFDIAWP